MAEIRKHTDQELASFLVDHADHLIDGGDADVEADLWIREAAQRLTAPLLPRLAAELERACTTSDPVTHKLLRGVIGEAQR